MSAKNLDTLWNPAVPCISDGGHLTEAAAIELVCKIHMDGGFTMSADGEIPTDGYMVAAIGHERIIPAKDYGLALIGELIDYAHQHADVLAEDGAYFGAWKDTDGAVFLDVSHRVSDLAQATTLGLQRDQLAVWGVAEKREFRLS